MSGQGKFLQRLPFDDHVLWQMSAVGRRRLASSVCLGDGAGDRKEARCFKKSDLAEDPPGCGGGKR